MVARDGESMSDAMTAARAAQFRPTRRYCRPDPRCPDPRRQIVVLERAGRLPRLISPGVKQTARSLPAASLSVGRTIVPQVSWAAAASPRVIGGPGLPRVLLALMG